MFKAHMCSAATVSACTQCAVSLNYFHRHPCSPPAVSPRFNLPSSKNTHSPLVALSSLLYFLTDEVLVRSDQGVAKELSQYVGVTHHHDCSALGPVPPHQLLQFKLAGVWNKPVNRQEDSSRACGVSGDDCPRLQLLYRYK